MKRLIITGDDFGRSLPVNEAIEQAHCRGLLSTTSLMVGEAAVADAVERARRLPGLRIGLHVTVVDGRSVLPPGQIPDLVDALGRFRSDLVRAGFSYFFRPAVRRQLRAEIRAQFEAFRQTGLPLDHVNAHHHMHLHPTILGMILEMGREFGLRAVRLPHEPWLPAWRALGGAPVLRFAAAVFLTPWAALMRWRLRRAGIRSNDFIFGMNDTGQMTLERIRRLIARLPEGVSELHFHPSGADQELRALTSPALTEALRRAGVERVGFNEL